MIIDNVANLITGAWVYNSFNKKPERVTEIRPLSVELDYNDLYDLVDGEIEGIPIDLEILKKNGFIIAGNTWTWSNESARIAIVFTDKVSVDVKSQVAKKDEKGRCDLITYARDWCSEFCVHELQMAIKMCKINKDIIL